MSDEHQLVLRSKHRESDGPQGGSTRINDLATLERYNAAVEELAFLNKYLDEVAARDEYKAALRTHEEKERELFHTSAQIVADYKTARGESISAGLSVFRIQDLMTVASGIPTSRFGERVSLG
jgi:hypothetical protein